MFEIIRDFYKKKKVLITGHTGFKGSWLTLWLNSLGSEVCGYSLSPPSSPSLFDILQLEKKISKHYIEDIRNFDKLKKVFSEFQPEIVFHFAAQSLVRYSYEFSRETYETNIMGTVNVLESIKHCNSVKSVVIITSDKCYENKEWDYGYRENDPMGGFDPYSSSKGCAELVTAAYRNSFFSDKNKPAVATGRAGNVIGGGDWALDRLVPDCIRSLSEKKKIIIRNPYSVRPWQFVLEPLYGYLILAFKIIENRKNCSGWNFGPNSSDILPVGKLAEKFIRFWGQGELEVQQDNKCPETKLLKLDITNSTTKLDWRPVYNSLEALKNTVTWYKKYYSGNEDMLNYSMSQLKEYEKRQKLNEQ